MNDIADGQHHSAALIRFDHQLTVVGDVHRQAHDIDYESSVADPIWPYIAM